MFENHVEEKVKRWHLKIYGKKINVKIKDKCLGKCENKDKCLGKCENKDKCLGEDTYESFKRENSK